MLLVASYCTSKHPPSCEFSWKCRAIALAHHPVRPHPSTLPSRQPTWRWMLLIAICSRGDETDLETGTHLLWPRKWVAGCRPYPYNRRHALFSSANSICVASILGHRFWCLSPSPCNDAASVCFPQLLMGELTALAVHLCKQRPFGQHSVSHCVS